MSSQLNSSSHGRNQSVQQWLADLFHDKDIPPFEENEQFAELLLKIMSKNIEEERNTKEIIKAEKKLADCYKKKSDDLCTILDREYLPLAKETLQKVESIATLSNQMNLREPTLTNFLLAMTEAENIKLKNQEKIRIIDYHLSCLSRKVTKTMKTNEIIKRDLENLEETAKLQEKMNSEITVQTSFLEGKSKEYTYRIKKSEKHLQTVGCEPTLYHKALFQRAESIKELETKVKCLGSKLDSYQALPTNELLAQLKVHETEAELKAMQEEFANLLETAIEETPED